MFFHIKVPAFIRKGKDVKVDIAKKHTKVQYKDETGEWMVVIDSDLTWDVRRDECMWTLTPGKNVLVSQIVLNVNFPHLLIIPWCNDLLCPCS